MRLLIICRSGIIVLSVTRYALNATTRTSSLYDALYGTDDLAEDNGCKKRKAVTGIPSWRRCCAMPNSS
jgi:hypothetical protein